MDEAVAFVDSLSLQGRLPVIMVIANPPPAEPVLDPGGVNSKPPFEMGVANLSGHNVMNIFKSEKI